MQRVVVCDLARGSSRNSRLPGETWHLTLRCLHTGGRCRGRDRPQLGCCFRHTPYQSRQEDARNCWLGDCLLFGAWFRLISTTCDYVAHDKSPCVRTVLTGLGDWQSLVILGLQHQLELPQRNPQGLSKVFEFTEDRHLQPSIICFKASVAEEVHKSSPVANAIKCKFVFAYAFDRSWKAPHGKTCRPHSATSPVTPVAEV